MTDLHSLLEWRLLSGSHKFPGPDGGTCINEAAIIAAGFDYRSVSSVDDCPPCFSRVLSAYAIILNDNLPDDVRQELLMPFVTQLADTADTPEIERQRSDHITLGLIRNVLPIVLRGWHNNLAMVCESVANYNQAIDAANKIALISARSIAHIFASNRARSLASALARDLADSIARDDTLVHSNSLAIDLAHAHSITNAFAPKIYKAQVSLLDDAMKIGRQAMPIEIAMLVQRAQAAKTLVSV